MTKNALMHWQNQKGKIPWEEQHMILHLKMPYPGHSLGDFHMDYECEGDQHCPELQLEDLLIYNHPLGVDR